MSKNNPVATDFNWAVLLGLRTNFMVYGPFAGEEDAEKWCESCGEKFHEIVPVYPPEPAAEPTAAERAAEQLQNPVFRFVKDRNNQLVVCYLNDESIRVTEHALPVVLDIARKLGWVVIKEQE